MLQDLKITKFCKLKKSYITTESVTIFLPVHSVVGISFHKFYNNRNHSVANRIFLQQYRLLVNGIAKVCQQWKTKFKIFLSIVTDFNTEIHCHFLKGLPFNLSLFVESV